MQEFINMLNPNLEFIPMYSNDECIIFQVQSKIKILYVLTVEHHHKNIIQNIKNPLTIYLCMAKML